MGCLGFVLAATALLVGATVLGLINVDVLAALAGVGAVLVLFVWPRD